MILKNLISETGHALVVEDCDDVLQLDELTSLVSKPVAENDFLMQRPVVCRNVVLYPPTIACLYWLSDYVCEWFDEGNPMRDMSVAFALAHSEDVGRLVQLSSKESSEKAVKSWWRRCNARVHELARAVDLLLPDTGDSDDNDSTYGSLVAMLTREYGESPEYWMCKASIGMIRTMVTDYTSRMIAESEAAKKAASGPGKRVSYTHPVKMDAISKQKIFIDALRDKWLTT